MLHALAYEIWKSFEGSQIYGDDCSEIRRNFDGFDGPN